MAFMLWLYIYINYIYRLSACSVVSPSPYAPYAVWWSHNERDGVSNHQPHDCLLNRLFMCRSKKTSKLHVTGFCAGNSPLTGEFPAQRASNAENISIGWRHHDSPRTSEVTMQIMVKLTWTKPQHNQSANRVHHPMLCLTAPSYYLNQRRPTISHKMVIWQEKLQPSITKISLKIIFL